MEAWKRSLYNPKCRSVGRSVEKKDLVCLLVRMSLALFRPPLLRVSVSSCILNVNPSPLKYLVCLLVP